MSRLETSSSAFVTCSSASSSSSSQFPWPVSCTRKKQPSHRGSPSSQRPVFAVLLLHRRCTVRKRRKRARKNSFCVLFQDPWRGNFAPTKIIIITCTIMGGCKNRFVVLSASTRGDSEDQNVRGSLHRVIPLLIQLRCIFFISRVMGNPSPTKTRSCRRRRRPRGRKEKGGRRTGRSLATKSTCLRLC